MAKQSLEDIFAERPSLDSIFAEPVQQVVQQPKASPMRNAANQVIGGINTAINTATGNIPEIIANKFNQTLIPTSTGDIAKGIGAGVGFVAPTGLPAQAMRIGAGIANPLTRSVAQGALGMASQFPVGSETLGEYATKVGAGGVAGALGRGVEKVVGGMTKTAGEKIAEVAKNYRKILNPTKTELNNLQLKLGKDVDKYYELAAKEGLIIKQSPEGRLDTQDAILQLQDKKTALVDELNTVLSSKKETFNLNNIAQKAKEEIKKKVKNATEYKELSKQIDTYIKDEIQANQGQRVVDPATLNKIKQGMWSVSYDPLRPNTRTAAREVGFAAKSAIDDAFEDAGIRKVNDTLGQYYTLETLLTNANNRPIGGSSVKRMAASVAGAIAGRNVPIVGPFVGSHIGSSLSTRMMNPEGATRAMASSVRNIGVSPKDRFAQFIGNIGKEPNYGKNRPLFHATSANFKSFDVSKTVDGAIWVTPNKDLAEVFRRGSAKAKGDARIIEAYGNLKKPLVLNKLDTNKDAVIQNAKKDGYDGLIIKNKEGKVVSMAFFNSDAIKIK